MPKPFLFVTALALTAILAAVLALGLYMLAGPAPPGAGPAPGGPVNNPGGKAVFVSDFIGEFALNQVLANDKYLGKVVDVKGCTGLITDHADRGVTVLLMDHREDRYGMRSGTLVCTFGPAERGRIAPLAPLWVVTVRGTCRSVPPPGLLPPGLPLLGLPTLEGCRVVAVDQEQPLRLRQPPARQSP